MRRKAVFLPSFSPPGSSTFPTSMKRSYYGQRSTTTFAP